jgi:hypothetical protein
MATKKGLPEGFKIMEGSDQKLYEQICDAIRANPKIKYGECQTQLKKKFKQWTFYRLRDALKGEGVVESRSAGGNGTVKAPKKRKQGLYMKVFTHPTKGLSKETKEVLRSFLEALNKTNRTNMELVEYVDPSEIEIREVR